MAEQIEPSFVGGQPPTEMGPQTSLDTRAARNLATTTKTVPQMQEITSRWLLKMLPWIQVSGGTYRVNRRLTYQLGDNRVSFVSTGSQVQVVPGELAELPVLRGFEDDDCLRALAERCVQRDAEPGEVLAERGAAADRVFLIAYGKVQKVGTSKYGDEAVLGMLAEGDYTGAGHLLDEQQWPHTLRAQTAAIVLTLSRDDFRQVLDEWPSLRAQVRRFQSRPVGEQNKYGEKAIALTAGHSGEPVLPGTFVDYEVSPREYQLQVAQTVLRVHSRVADLYNQPMNQVEQQLRLTVEALRERQEHEMINNPEFGLLANADLGQRIHTRTGPPTPDDLDELLSVVWKQPNFFLAHPRTIA